MDQQTWSKHYVCTADHVRQLCVAYEAIAASLLAAAQRHDAFADHLSAVAELAEADHRPLMASKHDASAGAHNVAVTACRVQAELYRTEAQRYRALEEENRATATRYGRG